ncbi:amidase family protein [Rhodotorula toruloides]|uniref:amidase n=1 Tax=Rhodotorula toruloides TaxID=5286 RepID=A0A511KC50_RHOTO|nr:amidase family protein [Rhodotorula toruloides]
MFGASKWQAARDAKRAEQRELIERGKELVQKQAAGVSDELDTAILGATAVDIVRNIEQKKPGWTATNVILVFIRSAIRSHEQTNAVTEILFDEAFERAQDLDAEFARTGKVVGPLHGVPVSLKDHIDIAGYDTSMGLTHMTSQPVEEDSGIARVLKKAGAVPFVKTNIPQTMLSFESSNPLFGITKNPYNPDRIPGGSSGGEAALLASDGSVLGIGSDIGGSLRIPAHFSGCFSLKPCSGRFPASGCQNFTPGFEGVHSTMGPMGRSVSDVEALTRVFLDASIDVSRTETGVIPMPYKKDVELPKKLKFGYYLNDGFCKASPACERAVLMAVEALRKKGHECVEFEPPNPLEAMEYFTALTSADRYETLLSFLRGDPVEPALWLVTIGPKLPAPLRWLLNWVCEKFLGDPKMARLMRASKGKSVVEVQEWQHRRDLWEEHGFDAVLCAPQATPALQHGDTWDLSVLAIGTILWNVIDSSVGLLPMTFVDASLDVPSASWWESQRASPGSALVDKRVYGKGGVYDAQAMEGLPVGLQIVGRQYDEERVVELMKVVDQAVGMRGFGPGEFSKRMKGAERVY